MPIHDPNNPHPAHSTEWEQANQAYEDELARRTGQHPACFPAGTPVLTPHGLRPIDELCVGDLVLALARGGELRARPIQSLPPPRRAPIFTIHWSSGEASTATTASHAFCTKRGWVRARDLRAADRVRRVNGAGGQSWSRVARTESDGAPAEVFNLLVRGDLNFIAAGSVVHSFGYARALRTAWHHVLLVVRHALRRPEGFGTEQALVAAPPTQRGRSAQLSTPPVVSFLASHTELGPLSERPANSPICQLPLSPD